MKTAQKIIVYARPDCKHCHGTGTVYDPVPLGCGYALMPSDCDCWQEVTDAETINKICDEDAEYEIREKSS